MKQIYLLVASAGDVDRAHFESIDGNAYNSKRKVFEELKALNGNIKDDDITFVRLSEFTTDWNDSETGRYYIPSVKDTYISHVIINE